MVKFYNTQYMDIPFIKTYYAGYNYGNLWTYSLAVSTQNFERML